VTVPDFVITPYAHWLFFYGVANWGSRNVGANLDAIAKILVLFAHEFDDRALYNAYKHSLRLVPRSQIRSMLIRRADGVGPQVNLKMGEGITCLTVETARDDRRSYFPAPLPAGLLSDYHQLRFPDRIPYPRRKRIGPAGNQTQVELKCDHATEGTDIGSIRRPSERKGSDAGEGYGATAIEPAAGHGSLFHLVLDSREHAVAINSVYYQ
jgi:hypothetical protein